METQVNLLAVLVAGVVMFALGGLWYSPALFAKKWVAAVGKSDEELKKGASGANYVVTFVAKLVSAYVLAKVGWASATVGEGVTTGFLCWFGFAAPTSYVHGMFAGRSTQLWVIDTGYTLVSFILAGAILAVWK